MPGFARSQESSSSGAIKTVNTRNVGATANLMFTVGSIKSALTSVLVTNKTGGTLPVSIWIERSTNVIYLHKNMRVKNGAVGEALKAPVALVAGDKIYAQTKVSNGFDVALCIQEGVL